MEVEESKEDEVDPQEDAEAKVDFPHLDVFNVEDVTDVGAGIPLFRDFRPEDWTLAALRVELHLLIKFFKVDSKDKDRTAIHVDHLAFYYNKYWKKQLNPKQFGMEDVQGVLGLVRDTIFLNKNVVQTLLPEDFETFSMFAKLAEEERRYRGLQIDLGKEEAKLKFSYPSNNWDNNNSWNKGGSWQNNKGSGGNTWQNNKGSGKAWGSHEGWGNNWNSSGSSWGDKSDKGYGTNKGGANQGKGFGKDSGYGKGGFGQQKRSWGGK